MRRARLIPFFLFALAARTPLRAQWGFTADAGVSHLRQAGIPESNAQTLGATLDAAGVRSAFRTSVLAARATSDSWTGQGLVVGSIVGPTAGAARWQLDGAVSAFGETSATPTTSAEVAARARLGSSLRGGAVGAGVGSSAHGSVRNPMYRAQSDAWWSAGDERLVVSAALTRTRSVFEFPANVQSTSPTISYLDVGANWRHDAGGLSFGAGGGIRGQSAQSGSSGATSGWGVVEAAAWLAPHVAVAVSGGRTLDDVVRGVPHTTFAGVVLRFAAQPHATISARPSTVAGPRITVERVGAERRRLDVHVDSASHVEIMGDFTNWTPVPLDRVGSAWRLELAIPPGAHRVAIRLDGGPWIVPVNLPRVEDDLAGMVGIITVP
ncbi:MAG TPA: glycogen-binding domain-containing protein [Gemmatimonadaceae bacterium]